MHIRGFEVAKGFVDKNINLPKRATNTSAGYDIESAIDIELPTNKVVLVPTGLKAYMQDNEVLKLYVRSSMAVKRKVMLANNVGVIDCDYYENEDNDGHIMIALINFGVEPLFIKKGERIAQGIFINYLLADNDELIENERTGGFGSSGK